MTSRRAYAVADVDAVVRHSGVALDELVLHLGPATAPGQPHLAPGLHAKGGALAGQDDELNTLVDDELNTLVAAVVFDD
jgi:hypothetical protein